jgi:mycothione reductase
VTSVAPTAAGVAVTIDSPTGQSVIESEVLLLATGRRPNTDVLDAAAGGLGVDPHGHLLTDSAYRTTVPGVWALGDAANHFQLKHMANAEVRVVVHNLMHPEDSRQLDATLVPHAVFSEPQIASVGVTEAQAGERRLNYLTATRKYGDTAYGWALEDTTSFVKLIADAQSRLLLGAHIIGPQAATLIQPGQTVDQLARDVLYIHPALTETLEQALLALPEPEAPPPGHRRLWRKPRS